MNKLVITCCASALLTFGATGALAGDIGLAGSTYDWSGGYVGTSVGAALNNTEFNQNYVYTGQANISIEETDLINGLDFSDTADDAWFTAGILAGYNWQYSNFVIGAEADFNYLGFHGTVKHDVSNVMSQVMAPENTTATDRIDYENNWYGTLRARLGYAIDNFLIYGTGGLAYGEMDINQKLDASNGDEYASWNARTNGWNLGWTLGGGMEYGMGRWTMGAEYLYVDLSSYEWSSNSDVGLLDSTLQDDWSEVREKGEAALRFSVARATLKYRF